ncbi:MAG TPA: enoyl-CoA hydratase, partial [Dehalococcoidia bacterium]
AVILSEVYEPEAAVVAGFLDRVVPAADLSRTANETAAQLGKLNPNAHTTTKLRTRDHTLKALRAAIEADQAAFGSAA